MFIGHAKLWVFADKYDIGALGELAGFQLSYDLANWAISAENFIADFGPLVRYIYDNSMTGCGLRLRVGRFAACGVVVDMKL